MRKIALSRLKQISIGRLNIRKKMLKATRDPAFLQSVIFNK